MSEEKKDYKIKGFEWNTKDTFYFLNGNKMYTGNIREILNVTCINGAAQVKLKFCGGHVDKYLYELFKTKEDLFENLEKLRDM